MIQPIHHGGYEVLRKMIIGLVTYFSETNYTIFLNKKVNRPMVCVYIDLAYTYYMLNNKKILLNNKS